MTIIDEGRNGPDLEAQAAISTFDTCFNRLLQAGENTVVGNLEIGAVNQYLRDSADPIPGWINSGWYSGLKPEDVPLFDGWHSAERINVVDSDGDRKHKYISLLRFKDGAGRASARMAFSVFWVPDISNYTAFYEMNGRFFAKLIGDDFESAGLILGTLFDVENYNQKAERLKDSNRYILETPGMLEFSARLKRLDPKVFYDLDINLVGLELLEYLRSESSITEGEIESERQRLEAELHEDLTNRAAKVPTLEELGIHSLRLVTAELFESMVPVVK